MMNVLNITLASLATKHCQAHFEHLELHCLQDRA